MKVLVIGSGGREHALVWKLAQSPKVKKIYCAPGNGGISQMAVSVTVSPENIPQLIDFAKRSEINLTIVGPEAPLSQGVVDEFEKEGLRIFGPRRNAAVLESSKCFTKEFCSRYDIPTAPYVFFSKIADARAFLHEQAKYPLVIKADGLAAGKGVVVAKSEGEAVKAAEDLLLYEKFGEAGRKIIVEEFLPGEEATFMVATDGKDFVCLESSQDHKRVFDGDRGPNTGGMGAYSPAPVVTDEVQNKVIGKIIRPLLAGMEKEGRCYRGILYAGLMIEKNEPSLVEFNCRFGDPEAQAILFRMKSDIVELVLAVLEGKLAEYKIKFLSDRSVCIVMAAGGYPGSFKKNKKIRGLEEVSKLKDVFVFHAGTRSDKGLFLTNGGRVLGVTARGRTLKTAINRAYKAVEKITWEGVHYRKDIGKRGIKREKVKTNK